MEPPPTPDRSAFGDRAYMSIGDGLVIEMRRPGDAWEVTQSDLPPGFKPPTPPMVRRIGVRIGANEAVADIQGRPPIRLSVQEGKVLAALLDTPAGFSGSKEIARVVWGMPQRAAQARTLFSALNSKLAAGNSGEPVLAKLREGRTSVYSLAAGFRSE